jgi:hypothetical protein
MRAVAGLAAISLAVSPKAVEQLGVLTVKAPRRRAPD